MHNRYLRPLTLAVLIFSVSGFLVAIAPATASAEPRRTPQSVRKVQFRINLSFERVADENGARPEADGTAVTPPAELFYKKPIRPEPNEHRAGLIAGLKEGVNTIGIPQLRDGQHYLYLRAAGHAPQWVHVTVTDGKASPEAAEVTLWRRRYVLLRVAFNPKGRALVGDGIETNRVAVAHWGLPDHFGHDWQVWQRGARGKKPTFGPEPWLDFHRIINGYGFADVPPGTKFDDVTEAPEAAAYQTESRPAVKGLLLYCRVNGDVRPPGQMGYGKVLVEDVTLKPPADRPVIEAD